MYRGSKIIKMFNLGWAEFLLAMVPLLSTYSNGIIHLDMVSCALVAIICLNRRKAIWAPPYYRMLVSYIFIHDIILCVTIDNFQMYHINNLINMMVFLFALMVIPTAIDINRFEKATYMIGVVVSLGILYQVVRLMSGGIIYPLPVPVVDWFFERSSTGMDFFRPMSFFEEPSAYANFMLVPMFFLLRAKKYIWYLIAVVFVLMSTSTTGVVCSFSLLFFNMFLNLKRMKQLVIFLLLFVVVAYGLSSIELFSDTTSKIENTEVSTNNRLSNGPNLIQNIPVPELVFGVNASNTQDYVDNNPSLYRYIVTYTDSKFFFVSFFWDLIINFGVFGFVLYFNIYYRLVRNDINVLPLVGTAGISSIFGGLGISSLFVYVMSTAIMCKYEDVKLYKSL